ncbi:hypothetical protein [Curtobacterium sp. MCSS17_016]|uniref:hypothetical protein n=1 Tax=Curtobacterium sp. MCSS17_016 TaxID=2175644 RepID=UPI000DA7A6DC|nr:hypothetical protein [Curtobacterium sp. MCSS17_016]WIE81366.1 hypothetical protein DEJ19_019215 [Curtobacterium sp. MCSS17_016]
MTLPTPRAAALELLRTGNPARGGRFPVAVPTTEGPTFDVSDIASRMVEDARAAVDAALDRAGL